MAHATVFTDWARMPASTLAQYNRSSPNLIAIRDDARIRFPEVTSLGIYGVRDARGSTTRSVHSWGAAADLSYRGAGRATGLAMIDFYLDRSAELGIQAIHDYLGSRIWRAFRPKASGGPGWKNQPRSSSGMGQSWADWIHIEVNLDAWPDGRSVAERTGDALPGVIRPIVGVGSRGPAVVAAQQVLGQFTDVGAADGVFGNRTLIGWQNVAAYCKWPVDSTIADDDWALLAWLDKGWTRLEAAGIRAA